MRKFFLFVITLSLLLLISNTADGQRWKLLRYEIIGGVGSTNIFGDIGGGPTRANWMGIKDIRILETRPSFNFGLRYKRNPNMSFKLNLIYGYGVGKDAGSVNAERNFSFTTHIFEHSLVFEYYFIPEERKVGSAAMYNRRGMLNNYSNISVYAFGGLGGVFANANMKGFAVSNSEDFVYNTSYGLVIPLGAGAKYVVDERWLVGVEFGGRYMLNDKIDGYSTIHSHWNDIYYFVNLNAIYKLKTDRQGFPAFFNGIFSRGQRTQSGNYRRR